MMPVPYFNHKDLLTLNTNEVPMFEDVFPDLPGRVDAQPLFLDPQENVWVVRAVFHPGTVLPTHYHTGTVHLFTLSGSWNYLEYPDQPQTAGSYLYEPGGSIHTFTTPADNTELTDTVMVVHGANVNFDAEGNYLGIMDTTMYMQLFDMLVKERGMEPAKYITPGQADFTRR